MDRPIEQDEVRAVIRALSGVKAAGWDGISERLLKAGGDELVEALTMMFNYYWERGSTPPEWGRGLIVPLFKKGDAARMDNYRPVTLLPVVAKVFGAVVDRRIAQFVAENELLHSSQAGFRQGYRAEDHLFTLFELVRGRMERGHTTYCGFLDIRKAYDTVDRALLMQKLRALRIGSKCLKVLESLYVQVQSCVRLGASVSELFQLARGLRQGCSLSPLLYSLFINDFMDYLDRRHPGVPLGPASRGGRQRDRDGLLSDLDFISIRSLLFADDVVLLAETGAALNRMLLDCHFYAQCSGFEFGADKCKLRWWSSGRRTRLREGLC